MLKIENILFMALIFCFSCSKPLAEETKKKKDPSSVSVLELKSGDFQILRDFEGEFKPLLESKISFEVSGTIKNIKVNEGDFVKKGDILASIDDWQYQFKFNSLNLVFKKARNDLKRLKFLFSKKAASKVQLEAAEIAFEHADNNLKNAKVTLSKVNLLAPFSGFIIKEYAQIGEWI